MKRPRLELLRLALAIVLLSLLGSVRAFASERHALVIGNNAYEYSATLQNPANDARKLAAALEQADFTVTLLLDGTHEEMEEGLRAFGRRLPQDSVALLFFAGHGMRVGAESYLMPVDARAEKASTLKYEAVSLEMALAIIDQEGEGAGLKIVILDSCRNNNPFGRNWSGSRSAAVNTGMTAPTQTPQGTYLCFATDPRKTAADGAGDNSPYTTALLRHLFTPGLDLDSALRRVGAEVQAATQNRQNPWRNSNFNGDFAFVGEIGGGGSAVFEGRQAGETRTIGGIEMVWCPPTGGEGFLMGSPDDEEGRSADETRHVVHLTDGFWIAQTECTRETWRDVMDSLPARSLSGDDIQDNYPVESVSWEMAVAWTKEMDRLYPLPSGWRWTLPTEAQWEYACRAGASGSYSGTGNLHEMGWFRENSGPWIQPVGTKGRNHWNLFDMHGNVSEWCLDYYTPYGEGPQTNPCGPLHGSERVLRGGYWESFAPSCRSAARTSFDWDPPGVSGDWLGFRPVISKRSPQDGLSETRFFTLGLDSRSRLWEFYPTDASEMERVIRDAEKAKKWRDIWNTDGPDEAMAEVPITKFESTRMSGLEVLFSTEYGVNFMSLPEPDLMEEIDLYLRLVTNSSPEKRQGSSDFRLRNEPLRFELASESEGPAVRVNRMEIRLEAMNYSMQTTLTSDRRFPTETLSIPGRPDVYLSWPRTFEEYDSSGTQTGLDSEASVDCDFVLGGEFNLSFRNKEK
ncbi:MAG: caspase family protein, partial [Verrucomicrobiota bacterium]